MSRILVIASYAGPRRCPGMDPVYMVREWTRVLTEFPNSLDLVVIVSNRAVYEDSAYIDALSQFHAASTPSIVLRRDNQNGSYGAWKYAWDKFGSMYDLYYIFEDDYRPNLPNWDDLLLECLGDADYVGGAISRNKGYPEHMGGATGLIREKALAATRIDEQDRNIYEPSLQIDFSRDMVEAGFKIVDYLDGYALPYRSVSGPEGVTIQTYGNLSKPALIVPMEWQG